MKTNQLIRIFLCLFFVLALQGCNQKKEATSVEKTLNLLPSEPQKKIPNPFNENKTRAEQGDASAQYNLGYAYATGKGVAKDEVEAVNWFRKSASQNNTKAQVYLGNCYMDGVGVKKNIEEAFQWYRQAAQQTNALAQLAQLILGDRYLAGDYLPEDDTEGVKWFRKAAELNNAEAQCSLESVLKI